MKVSDQQGLRKRLRPDSGLLLLQCRGSLLSFFNT